MTLAVLALGCLGNSNTSKVVDTAPTEADADADADTDTDTDVSPGGDSGLLEVYWEGEWSDTFVGTHKLIAYYNRYANDDDPATDPVHCVYTWDTVASSVLTTCDGCDFAFTVEHSSGAPSSTTNCKKTLQLGTYGVDLADQDLGFAPSHVENEQTYNNVLVEYIDGSWTYIAPAVFDGVTLTYTSPVSYYYY